MCKEMPVLTFDRMVDKKRIIRKMEVRGGEAHGIADPKKALSTAMKISF
jgi:hypothetical protein